MTIGLLAQFIVSIQNTFHVTDANVMLIISLNSSDPLSLIKASAVSSK